jgi:uncharacterized protein with PIN domain
MIVDTSALVAIFTREPGYEALRDALASKAEICQRLLWWNICW